MKNSDWIEKHTNYVYDLEEQEEKEILDDVEFLNVTDTWFKIADILLIILFVIVVLGLVVLVFDPFNFLPK